jgi:hypothetical protein
MSKHMLEVLSDVREHSVSDFLFDEEASIPMGKLLVVGALMVVLSVVLNLQDALAGHGSHVSHGSHSSHSSGSGGHSSHESHASHESHSSHSSGSGGYSSNESGSDYSDRSTFTVPTTPKPTATPKPTPTPVPVELIKTPQTPPDTLEF